MVETKAFRSYSEQLDILESRGMVVENRTSAEQQLKTLNYYRLSGYWHSMWQLDGTGRPTEVFKQGASFELCVALYEFDARLRQVVFEDLCHIEIAVRALLGYHLGRIHPQCHLEVNKLGAVSKQVNNKTGNILYRDWLKRFYSAYKLSKDNLITHHREIYGLDAPVWVAVEVMDWGMLSYLYRMSPNTVRSEISGNLGLSAPQLESWLKSLNILRNYAAHNVRIFNRVFTLRPKLGDSAEIRAIKDADNRVFGHLTLIRYLHRELGISVGSRIVEILESYPHNELIPFNRLGVINNWREHPLWNKEKR